MLQIAEWTQRCKITRRRMFTGLGLVVVAYVMVSLAAYSTVYRVKPVLVRAVVNYTALTQVLARRAHIFSAAITNYAMANDPKPGKPLFQNSPNYSTIVITGWEHRDSTRVPFSCCIWLNNDTIVNASVRHKQYRSTKVILRATLFRCPLTVPWSEVKGLSLAERTGQCPNETRFYLKPFLPPLQQTPGLAICNKLAYFSVDPIFLIEWLEIQKFLGVSKVLTYPYMLDKDAVKVLEYYSSIGFVDIFKYDYPDKDVVKRTPGSKKMQYFSDESVTVYDCQERLRHYKYAAVLDKDEIILPLNTSQQGALLGYLVSRNIGHQEALLRYLVSRNNSQQTTLLSYLVSRYRQATGALQRYHMSRKYSMKPNRYIWTEDAAMASKPVAALKFRTQFHDLSRQSEWRGENSSRLMFAHATNCTSPVMDRPKNIYMPLRVTPGSVTTHQVKPAAGYKRETVSAVTIHHYRNSMRKKHKTTLPFTKCEHLEPLANLVTDSVMNVRRKLEI